MSRHWKFNVSSVSPKKKTAMAETEVPEAYNMTFSHDNKSCQISVTLKMPSKGIFEEECDKEMDPKQAKKLAEKICKVIDKHTEKAKKKSAAKKKR